MRTQAEVRAPDCTLIGWVTVDHDLLLSGCGHIRFPLRGGDFMRVETADLPVLPMQNGLHRYNALAASAGDIETLRRISSFIEYKP